MVCQDLVAGEDGLPARSGLSQDAQEKLQWLKLYNRRSEYTQMVDKVGAKEYAAEVIGREYIISTLGVWERPEEIDFDWLPDCMMVCLDRDTKNTKFYFFDRDWKLLRYNVRGIEAPEDFTLPWPAQISEMFDLAEKLSQGLPFARIDLYNVNGRIYFGEITLYPASGLDPNFLPATDAYFGSLIDLNTIEKR